MRDICITAHTGACRTKSNTVESARAGLACPGVGCIEADIRFLSCGAPALGHDWVNSNSPRLADVFALMQSNNVLINLDMKEITHVDQMIKLLDTYGLRGRAFMTGLREDDCKMLRNCGLAYYLNGTDITAAKQLGAIGVNFHHQKCSEALVHAAHEAGLLVSVFTVDKRRAMKKMVALGVDNITTRRPNVLAGVIGL